MQRLVLTFLVLFIPQVSPAQVPVDAFASLPREVMPVLSPEGQKIASVVSLYGQQVVLVRSIGGKEKPKLIYRTDNKKSRIQWLEWANSERLLIALRAPSKRFGLDTTETRLASIVYDGTGLVNMVPLKSNERIPQFQDDVIDLLPADSDHVLMSLALSSTRGKLMDGVYKVNVNTGKRKRVQSPTADILQWQIDRFHRVRLNVKLKRGITTISVRDPNEKNLRSCGDSRRARRSSSSPLALAAIPTRCMCLPTITTTRRYFALIWPAQICAASWCLRCQTLMFRGSSGIRLWPAKWLVLGTKLVTNTISGMKTIWPLVKACPRPCLTPITP